MLDDDRAQLHLLVDQLLDGIEENAPPGVVIEASTLIAIVVTPEPEGVREDAHMISTTAQRYVQEGILRAALREHEAVAYVHPHDDDDDA